MPKLIAVEDLLRMDQESKSEHTVADIAGDSYLFKHNFPFRRVREEAISCGVKFSPDLPFMDVYQKAPLFCLEEIVGSNSIPYFKTAVTLDYLAKKYPGITINEVLSTLSGFSNYVAHESAHCITNKALAEKDSQVKESLIYELLAESVAFCTDFYCAVAAQNKDEECKVFIDMNCYSSSRKKQRLYQHLLEFMTPEQINLFLIRGYLGVLLTPLDLDDLTSILDSVLGSMGLTNLDVKMRGECLMFFEGLYGITVGFREYCVPVTYRKLGRLKEFESLRGIHLMNSTYIIDSFNVEMEKVAKFLDYLFIDPAIKHAHF